MEKYDLYLDAAHNVFNSFIRACEWLEENVDVLSFNIESVGQAEEEIRRFI